MLFLSFLFLFFFCVVLIFLFLNIVCLCLLFKLLRFLVISYNLQVVTKNYDE